LYAKEIPIMMSGLLKNCAEFLQGTSTIEKGC
jgi:hypothetical protein